MANRKKTARQQSATTPKPVSARAGAVRGKPAKTVFSADSKPVVGVGKKRPAVGGVGNNATGPSAAGRKTAAKKAVGKTTTAAPSRVAKRPGNVAVATTLPIVDHAVHSAATQERHHELKFGIESAFERRATLTMNEIDGSTRAIVTRVIDGLESGQFRVAEPDGRGGWTVNEWVKKAVLLYFRVNEMVVIEAQPAPFWDKVESRFSGFHEAEFRKAGVRVVPGAVVRRGSYFGKDVVLMPSFTNIGAYVGEGTMVDTWATVGSCAQIGKHCHLSGGAGIGGVLEPLQASPTIIEDHCFIGARSEVVEGVIVGHHSVIGMGVFISQSTRIYNRATGEISYGYVPPYSVVVSGQLPSKDGSHSLYCAVIVKQVDAKTRSKTSVNDLLRGLAD